MAVLDPLTYNLQRDLWPQKKIFEHILKASPTLQALPKDKTFYQRYRYIDEGIGTGQGIGADFGTAKANKSPDESAEYKYSIKTLYTLFSIPGEMLMRAENDQAVIVDPYARASKNAIEAMKRELSFYLFGNGGGALSRLSTSTTLSSNTAVLANVDDVRFFYKNQYVQLSSDDGTGGAGVRSGRLKVVDVKREGANKGQVVFDQAITTGIPAAVAQDYLFRESCYNKAWNGFKAHIPTAAPSGTFLGVDRTTLTAEKAGVRLDARNKSPVNAAYAAAMEVVNMWGEPNLYILNTADWDALRMDITNCSVVQVPVTGYGGKVVPGMTYSAIEIMGPKGKIQCIADADCPLGYAWMLTREVWKVASMGELVRLITKTPMMEDAADSWESRFVTRSDLQCEAHGPNVSVKLRNV